MPKYNNEIKYLPKNYFIVCRFNNGARYYSENMTYNQCVEAIKVWYPFVRNRGGGNIELIEDNSQICLRVDVDE